ncbi:MAG: Vps62-related protein [Nannocystaceae bacterium]
MAITLETIRKFAPLVRLHAYDRHRPLTVPEYLKTVSLHRSSGALITEIVTPDTLAANSDAGNYLQWKAPLPTGNDDAASGAPIIDGKCTSTCYVKVFEEAGYTDIVYAFLYALSGFQTLRVGIQDGFYSKKRNFCWARMARHEADWEHVTVRITSDGARILNIFFGQHGGSQCLRPDQVRFVAGTSHPIVWSAWNTHSNYASSGVVKSARLIAGILPINWLDLADVTTNDSLEYHVKPSPFFSAVYWETWDHIEHVNGNAAAAKWLTFPGTWGRPLLDNSHFDLPPSLPANAHKVLLGLANVVTSTGVVSLGKYLTSDSPRSPEKQGWWRNKEPKLVYLRSVEHGGGGGSSFDDSSKLTLYQTLRRISIRSGSRVDQVEMVLSDGTTLRHGGTGGTAQPVLDIPASDALVRVELCLGSKDGSDRVFWIKFTTREGRTLEGGVKTDKLRVIEVPDNFTAIGMYGRCGSEFDRFGLLMRVPSVEQEFYASAQHGGTGGTAFNDTTGLTRFQWVQTITLRAGSRVDQVGFVLNEGAADDETSPAKTATITHGGGGGTPKSLDLEEDDRIVRLELSLGSVDGGTRVFWIRFTTEKGLSLEGGVKSGPVQVINVPDGFTPLGFIGRAGSAVDKLGLVMRSANGVYQTSA